MRPAVLKTRAFRLVACGTLAVLLCGAALRPAADAPLRVGVADITRIFDSYVERQRHEGEIKAAGEDLRDREELLRADIIALDERMSQLSLGSPEREALRKELGAKQQERQRFAADARRELDAMIRRSTATLYEDITRAIDAYAEAQGLDLVLKQQSFDDDQPTAESQALAIGRRTVLYARPGLDITAPIVEKLNREAAARPAE
jgi:Skp family chaperone for outer membrane proteins